ncbi:hypothetical protein PP182_09235 [Maribacter sp. PR1]|nr:hypothetical protein [Maribacter sp. PR1]MDC6388864.1 hypothetical protein [Maribacter sp. PR1]
MLHATLTYPKKEYIKTGYSYPIKLNYARGGCKRESEISLPKLSKWAKLTSEITGWMGSKIAKRKSMVCE